MHARLPAFLNMSLSLVLVDCHCYSELSRLSMFNVHLVYVLEDSLFQLDLLVYVDQER